MTREEAIKNREDCLKYLEGLGLMASPECVEAVRWSVKALKALRPVSREQVERMRGEWRSIHGLSEYYCSRCGEEFEIHAYDKGKYRFCPHCMAPMTDEAVEMVMKRMEALYEQ